MSDAHSTDRKTKRGRYGKHGHCKGRKPTRAYTAWANMHRRCYSKDDKCQRDYGTRGIQVCERWRGRPDGFENFLADMGEPPPKMTLDRIDNGGDYEPGNCRWATRSTQQRNMRSNRLVTFQGKTQCLAAWVEETGIPAKVLNHRLRRGWPLERALKQPPSRRTQRRK